MPRIRQRFSNPDGWSSKGERIRDRNGNPVGLGLIQGEGDLMARTGNDEVARGADVPLVLAASGQTRDALVDPKPGDYLGDPEKGNHVGEVRQPAEPVLTRDGAVHFEPIGDDTDSKFTSTYAEDFAKLEERVQGDPAYAGVMHVAIETDPDRVAAAEEAARGSGKRSRSSRASASPDADIDYAETAPAATVVETGTGAADTLDKESATVARAQAAEDKKRR